MSANSVQVATLVAKRKWWTQSESEGLRSLLSNLTIDQVAQKLSRTKIAIVVKAKKLGISKNERDGWYTEQEVAGILGMDSKTVRTRILNGTLVANPHDSDRPPRKGKSAPWHITRENLVDFIRRFPRDLQGRNVNMPLIIDILVGIKISYH